ncbi:MAG: NAD(P)(+) transhydrogenase (Re/Si-specific) subunit alpha, partial [Tropicimonas sp.]
MKIGSPREIFPGESRVALTPDSAKQLQKLGYECAVESGAGQAAGFSDTAYREAGVEVIDSAEALFAASDIIAKVRPPADEEVARLNGDKTLISFFYPASNEALMEAAKGTG